MRIGIGYDVHKLTENRKLILGGVEVPYKKGLLGHSDADVLVHAVMDALLGAVALGDIGRYFPDSDKTYQGADSMVLLSYVRDLIEKECYLIGNIDATIIAQQPKLASFLPQMAKNIANILKVSEKQVNVKATTEEGLGFTGNGEGISAQAICLLETVDNYLYKDIYNDKNSVIYSYDIENRDAQQEFDCNECKGCCQRK